jgi:hypothetical protein
MNHKQSRRSWLCGAVGLLVVTCGLASANAEPLRVGVFDIDASPEIGAPLAYDPCVEVTVPLSCRGVVIAGAGEPIVLCAVDWLGVANEAHDAWRGKLARAVGTSVERVALHAIHQHDAPRCDLTSATLLAQHAPSESYFDVPWIRDVMDRSAAAAATALSKAQPVDAIATAAAEVHEVASNRRILGADGRVRATRYTACRDPKLRAEPAGVVDPLLRMVALYDDDQPVVVLSYFATHPQSYYRTGQANPDFVGYARNARQQATEIPHVHFNGAGGNIGAGKWNDGSRENRQVLADKVADAMERAHAKLEPRPLEAADVDWRTVAVALPPGEHLREDALLKVLEDESAARMDRLTAAKHLAWLRRTEAGQTIDLQCLALGDARILHMPGELFVEYQLAAAEMRPDLFVAMAAYGEYGPGYIGTAVSYGQGGYETSQRASRVGPGSEQILTDAMQQLLK